MALSLIALAVGGSARALPSLEKPVEVLSRELVDLEVSPGGAVLILVSAPESPAPGLSRWEVGATTPKATCAIQGRTAFSFDRNHVLEFTGIADGTKPTLRVRNATSCKLERAIAANQMIVDADVRGGFITIATRENAVDGRLLHLLDRRDRIVASTAVGRNLELGFAPDGRSVVNFDPSDDGPTLWRVPSLQALPWPAWSRGQAPTFIPATSIVAYRSGDRTALVHWPEGRPLAASILPPDSRLHRVSANARLALITQRGRGQERLLVHDFARHRSATIFEGPPGSIDHASISADGRWIAWSERDSLQEHRVRIHRQPIADIEFRP